MNEEVDAVVAVVEIAVKAGLVKATRSMGVKAHEVAEGFSELRDEYVSLRVSMEMLRSVSCLLLQQMLI